MSQNKTVTLFIQCLVDGVYPEVGEAMVRIFRKLGMDINCPTQQTCCGQPAFNSGYRREARVAGIVRHAGRERGNYRRHFFRIGPCRLGRIPGVAMIPLR